MFTVEQIKKAHSMVKSGSDFPAYIKQIKALGVTAFETWVVDSHTNYFGEDHFQTSSAPMYDALVIAADSKGDAFRSLLQFHQQGKTDYLTFCNDCARTGIEKWFANLQEMTCTYFDKKGKKILVEKIPG